MVRGYQNLLNYIVNAYIETKHFKAYQSFENIVIDIGRFRLIVRRTDLFKRILNAIHERMYNNFKPMDQLAVLNTLERIVSTYPLIPLIGIIEDIFRERDLYIRKQKRTRKEVWHDRRIPKIPGKYHYILTIKKKRQKILYVSNHRVNDQSVYEIPLVNQLKRVWPLPIYRNYCILRIERRKYNFMFELDVVSFDNDTIYIFEIKNRKVNQVFLQIYRMLRAARYLKLWRRSMGNNPKFLVPIFYIRNGHSDGINTLSLEEVLSSIQIDPKEQQWLSIPLSINSQKALRDYLEKQGFIMNPQ